MREGRLVTEMARQPSSGPSGRIEAVDAVRGLAVFMMVFSHGLHWLYVGTSHDVFSWAGLSVGDLAAPVFFVVAGVALRFSLRSRLQAPGAGPDHVWRTHRRRFRQLFILGVPISVLWGVLQAQALALTVVAWAALRPAPCARTVDAPRAAREEHAYTLKTTRGFVLSAAALAGHVAVSRLWPGAADWPLAGGLVHGAFPAGAVLALVAFGFGFGGLMREHRLTRQGAAGGLAAGGAALAAVWAGGDMQRAGMPPAYLLLGAALTMTALSVFHARPVRRTAPVRFLARIGRRALFLFLAHYIVLVVLAFGFGWWNGLPKPAAVAAAAGVTAVTGVLGARFALDARAIYGALDRWEARLASSRPARAAVQAASRPRSFTAAGTSLPLRHGPGGAPLDPADIAVHPMDRVFEVAARLQLS